MKNILVTHTDLDGIGCEILFRKYFQNKDLQVYNCDYNNVNETILNILENEEDFYLYITDLSVNELVAEKLDRLGNVLLLDHHPTALWLTDKYHWAIVDTSICGTKLFYNYLNTESRLSMYNNFVTYVDDYDRWVHNYGISKKLNRLLYLIGKEKFVERFLKDEDSYLTPTEQTLLKVEEARMERYLEKSKKKIYWSGKSIIIFAEQYHSELGHYLLNKFGANIVFIVNPRDMKVSLRSRKDVDCSVIARSYGGGGHPQASGFQLTDDNIQVIFDEIF